MNYVGSSKAGLYARIQKKAFGQTE